MKKCALFAALVELFFLVCIVHAGITVNNYADLSSLYDDYFDPAQSSGFLEVNGKELMWYFEGEEIYLTFDNNELPAVVFQDKDAVLRLLASELEITLAMIGGVGNGDTASAYTSAAGVTSRMVFQNLVIPAAKTRTEQKKDEALKAFGKARTIGASLSWEDVDFDASGENGDIYGANVGLAWDQDSLSYGFILPYDYLDFGSFDAQRIGLIGFGQFHQPVTDNLSACVTGHLNYSYTDLDFDAGDGEDVNMYGGGLSGAVSYNKDLYILSAGVSYLYNSDDSDVDEDEQHLVKTGINAGIRNGDNGVINVFAVWNIDITDYATDPEDDDYYEVGFESSFSLSDTFGLTLGYKKVLELENFDADQIYLGSLWKF